MSMPNGTPVIASLKEAALNEKIIPGDFDNSGKIEMSDVSSALKAYVNETALDYRTFKASDMDNNGVLNLADVTLLLRKYVNS